MIYGTPALWADPAFAGPLAAPRMEHWHQQTTPAPETRTMKKLLITAALLATFGAARADSNLVVDGGFEAQAQAAGTWNIYNSITGWSTFSGAGIEVRNQVAGTAFEGSNFVELDSSNNSAMTQTLSTTAGASYTLSFEYSARAGVAAASNPIQVYWNGNLLATAMLDGIGQSNNVWHQYNFMVQGTGSDTLKFAAAGIGDGLGGSLDAVSVTAAVPEPSTYAMMFGGLALIGFSLRRRRSPR